MNNEINPFFISLPGIRFADNTPAFSDAVEFLFDIGNELVGDGISVRPQVFRIHRVRVIFVKMIHIDFFNRSSIWYCDS